MEFTPDYRNIVDAVMNRKPARLPLYEHAIDYSIMSKVLRRTMTPPSETSSVAEFSEFYKDYCDFYKAMTYDTISFEGGIARGIPESGAIYGGKPGPIQNRENFDQYDWASVSKRYWKFWTPHFEALKKSMPNGMKLIGGAGLGVFELSEDFVGYEYLCMMQFDDPELFKELFVKIGDLMFTIWTELLEKYGDLFCVCRFGDDLGFKSSTLLSPNTIIEHIVPQYKRLIDLIHSKDKPFLFHSCGFIFPVMEEIIKAGINAKHSNEDQIAPFDDWIEKYSNKIGLMGGIDVNTICMNDSKTVYEAVLEAGIRFRKNAKGYALGSGNSIPNYVPVEGYLAMIEAAKEIRSREG